MLAHIADDARLTSTGLVMGTPGYLSPELVEGAPVSTSTDWWGWAATLAFAAQGEPPFGRGPMPAVLDRVTRGQANLGGVDARLRPLLAAALAAILLIGVLALYWVYDRLVGIDNLKLG